MKRRKIGKTLVLILYLIFISNFYVTYKLYCLFYLLYLLILRSIPILAIDISKLLPPYDKNGKVTPVTSFMWENIWGCFFMGDE